MLRQLFRRGAANFLYITEFYQPKGFFVTQVLIHPANRPCPFVIRQRRNACTQLCRFPRDVFRRKFTRMQQNTRHHLRSIRKQTGIAAHGKVFIYDICGKADQLCFAALADNRLYPRAIQLIQLCGNRLLSRKIPTAHAQHIRQQCRQAASLAVQRQLKHRAEARGLALRVRHAGQSQSLF